MVIYNPIERKLSRSLDLNMVPIQISESSWNIGPTNGYVIENSIKKLKNIEIYSMFTNMPQTQTTYLSNQRIDIQTKRTDENFFEIFTLKFIEGHPYNKNDIETSKKVCVINESLSLRCFGDTKSIGKKIIFNNDTYTVCGVVKDVPALYKNAYAELWRPYNYVSYMNHIKTKDIYSQEFKAVVIAYNKSDFKGIQSQLTRNLDQMKPKDVFKIHGTLKTPFQTNFGMFDNDNPFSNKADNIKNLSLASFMIGLFLLLPLLNLTSLTVSRIFERSSEIGVRKSFGATKYMMIWQFVYENIIVCLLGGLMV
jgi:putative ABC transport system permease protein